MKQFNKFVNNVKSKIMSNNNNVIIHNKFVLYFIFFISLANLFYLSIEQDIISIVTFILIGFLTTFFSKNMLIILFIALTITNILKYGSAITNEGFEEEEEEEDKKENMTEDEPDEKDKKKTDKKESKKESLDKKKDNFKGKDEEIVISKKKLDSGNLDDIHKEEEALKKKEEKTTDKNDKTDETIKMFSKIVNALNN